LCFAVFNGLVDATEEMFNVLWGCHREGVEIDHLFRAIPVLLHPRTRPMRPLPAVRQIENIATIINDRWQPVFEKNPNKRNTIPFGRLYQLNIGCDTWHSIYCIKKYLKIYYLFIL